jgi:hypothetical protein
MIIIIAALMTAKIMATPIISAMPPHSKYGFSLIFDEGKLGFGVYCGWGLLGCGLLIDKLLV